jgi:hypothetical protein
MAFQHLLFTLTLLWLRGLLALSSAAHLTDLRTGAPLRFADIRANIMAGFDIEDDYVRPVPAVTRRSSARSAGWIGLLGDGQFWFLATCVTGYAALLGIIVLVFRRRRQRRAY